MHRLLIVGAGGHGIVVAETAELSQEWSHISFVDDLFPDRRDAADWQIVGSTDDLKKLGDDFDAAVVAIGNNVLRLKNLEALDDAKISLATVIHPSAYVSRLSEIGAGTVLMANTVVNARAVLGKSCIINTAASVDHDCQLADGVHIAPGAHLAAEVIVGDRSLVGVGASVRGQIRIGSDVVVGAGSAVVKDVESGAVIAGVPAKPVRSQAILQVMQGKPR